MSTKSTLVTYKYLIVACLASVMMSTFASYFFYSKWNEAEDRYTSLVSEKSMLSKNYDLVKSSFDKAYGDLLLMRDENASVISLHAADSTKRYAARVYWNHYTRETFIDVLSLPETDSVGQYQLWAMSGGQPVDAGLFTASPEEGTQRVKPVANADAWAVTVEPKGGSAIPTTCNIVLMSAK